MGKRDSARHSSRNEYGSHCTGDRKEWDTQYRHSHTLGVTLITRPDDCVEGYRNPSECTLNVLFQSDLP